VPRTKQIDRHSGSDKFTEPKLKQLAEDLHSGRLPLQRTQISDDLVSGLRANVNSDSRMIAFHVSYAVGKKRPFCKIGELTDDPKNPWKMTIPKARQIASTIKKLGHKGIDVQDGLHQRLVRELDIMGEDWRPDWADKAIKKGNK
jgi:hypothetical protein